MFKDFINDLKAAAHQLPKPREKYTLDELADEYCLALDAGNTLLREAYFAAMLLNYQAYIVKLYKDHHAALKMELEDFISWVSGSIMMACDPSNRKWQKDTNIHAGTVIVQILKTRFQAAAYYESNLAKNRVNFATVSLDAPTNDDADGTIVDMLESNIETPAGQLDGAYCLIQELLDQNKIIEAIIAETIAYNDCYRINKEIVDDTDLAGNAIKRKKYSQEFWAYRAVQILSNLPENYEKYFCTKFNAPQVKVRAGLNKIQSSSNTKIKKYIIQTQECLRALV